MKHFSQIRFETAIYRKSGTQGKLILQFRGGFGNSLLKVGCKLKRRKNSTTFYWS